MLKRFKLILFALYLILVNGLSATEVLPLLQTRYLEFDGREMRLFEDISLETSQGIAHFTVSRPQQVPDGGLPCVFIISGLETGRKSLQLIPDHGNFILVSYEYPSDIKKIKRRGGLFYLPKVRKATLSVPEQVNAALDYLSSQSYVDKTPISMIGISFGSAFLPAILHLRTSQSKPFGPIVFGYGGAGLRCLFKAAIPGPQWFRGIAARIAAAIFHPIEPALHFPYIQGDFLIVSGVKDKIIPIGCIRRLQDLAPNPKTIIDLETDHLQPDNHELLTQLITISRKWLEEQIALLQGRGQ